MLLCEKPVNEFNKNDSNELPELIGLVGSEINPKYSHNEQNTNINIDKSIENYNSILVKDMSATWRTVSN